MSDAAGTAPATVSRDAAWRLFCEWTASEALRKHVLGVEAAMRAYARERGEDEELWGVTGILHDLDYERHPDPETGHPRMALAELRRRGYPEELVDAVAGTPTTWAFPASPRWPGPCTRSTSCRGSSPRARWSGPRASTG